MALTQTLRVAVTLNPSATGADRVMNTWHIATRDGAMPLTAAIDFRAALDTFYQAIDAYLTNGLTGSVPEVNVYNLIENKPRQPIYTNTLTTLTGGTARTASELAVCVSYKADYISGVTPKRRRGRIYLGPLAAATVDTTTGQISAAAVTAISNAADALFDASDISTTFAWVVYSPTTDTNGTGEVGMYEVVGGWVDNNVDVQRRRGTRGGTKTLFS